MSPDVVKAERDYRKAQADWNTYVAGQYHLVARYMPYFHGLYWSYNILQEALRRERNRRECSQGTARPD